MKVMSDDIHKTHFTVPEMPYKRKEQEAMILFGKVLTIISEINAGIEISVRLTKLLRDNKNLVDWVMKYKGE